VNATLAWTPRLTAHELLAKREAELLGCDTTSSEHLLRAVLWSGECFGGAAFGDEARHSVLLARLVAISNAPGVADGWTLDRLTEEAATIALEGGSKHLGFEHIIRAWLEEPSGPVSILLDENHLRDSLPRVIDQVCREHP
jgi:hypothetical protein